MNPGAPAESGPTQPPTNRMCKLKQFGAVAAIATFCVIAAVPPQAALAAISADQARESIEKQFGVKVLKITSSTLDGKPVYLLTIMSPGGNSNSAFQVSRIAVDPETGKLVLGSHHLPSGYNSAGGDGTNEPNRNPTDVLRQGWNWR